MDEDKEENWVIPMPSAEDGITVTVTVTGNLLNTKEYPKSEEEDRLRTWT
jgi:hypothetical protein